MNHEEKDLLVRILEVATGTIAVVTVVVLSSVAGMNAYFAYQPAALEAQAAGVSGRATPQPVTDQTFSAQGTIGSSAVPAPASGSFATPRVTPSNFSISGFNPDVPNGSGRSISTQGDAGLLGQLFLANPQVQIRGPAVAPLPTMGDVPVGSQPPVSPGDAVPGVKSGTTTELHSSGDLVPGVRSGTTTESVDQVAAPTPAPMPYNSTTSSGIPQSPYLQPTMPQSGGVPPSTGHLNELNQSPVSFDQPQPGFFGQAGAALRSAFGNVFDGLKSFFRF